MASLRSIRIAGWKSFGEATVTLTPLTVMIGANGAGKSNFLSLFRLLNVLFARMPEFQSYVGKSGYAEALLHYGLGRTPAAELELDGSRRLPGAELELVFETDGGENRYFAQWEPGAGGTLLFKEECIEFLNSGSAAPQVIPLGTGHAESKLIQAAEDDPTARTVLWLLRNCRLFHFHDTSENSAARQPSYVEANRFLYPDAGNLASMLYLYQGQQAAAYRRITAAVRQMVPDFGDFVLELSKLNDRQRRRGKR